MTSGLVVKTRGKARLSVRKSSLALSLFCVGLLLLGLMFIHARLQHQADAPRIQHMAGAVTNLELTDLSLFTEARYSRHPSQADLHSAFQDHPMSLEHFPTGSIVPPPLGPRRPNDKMD